MIDLVKIAVTTTGVAGSAAGSGNSGTVINGHILAVNVDYHASAPGTTDLAIATTAAPTRTIYSKDNANTDTGWLYPRVPVHDTAGTAVTFDGTHGIYEPIPVNDVITVTLAQCDALTAAVVVTILVER